jgi:L-asparaginase II
VSQVLAEVVRNGFVESRHRGALVALGADGTPVLAVGDVTGPVLPRSSMKPLQTLGMLRAGWQPADDEQVALACASHNGEPAHIDVVRRILASAGVEPAALDNTADLPLSADAAHDLLRAGGSADSLHQNCSGKHAAMLATCVGAGWPTTGYRQPDHPLQQAIRATIEELCGEQVAAVTVDGCGAPLFAVSLTGLARGFARLATSDPATLEGRIARAMSALPFLVGGTGRDVTALMTHVAGLVAKDGAEGVYAAALPDGRSVALKIDDGAGRARAPVMVAALRRLGVTDEVPDVVVAPPVLGHGRPVGAVRATLPD